MFDSVESATKKEVQLEEGEVKAWKRETQSCMDGAMEGEGRARAVEARVRSVEKSIVACVAR